MLLSQQHRQRALELLAQFLDLGPWAVNHALSVGIFPYVLKLLQSPASELRLVLVFIWAKILVLDKVCFSFHVFTHQSCQFDLVKDNGQHYFINVLSNSSVPVSQRQQAAFILSVICHNCRPGQTACLNGKLLKNCLSNLNHPDALLRRFPPSSSAHWLGGSSYVSQNFGKTMRLPRKKPFKKLHMSSFVGCLQILSLKSGQLLFMHWGPSLQRDLLLQKISRGGQSLN